MDQHASDVWKSTSDTLDNTQLSVMARSMLAARKALNGPLPSELIADPALDILLHTLVAQTEGHRLNVESVPFLLTVAATVGKRWIAVLLDYGLVQVNDGQIVLSASGMEAMTVTLRAVADSQYRLDAAF